MSFVYKHTFVYKHIFILVDWNELTTITGQRVPCVPSSGEQPLMQVF